MSALKALRARLRSAFFRRAADQSLSEEIRFHLAMETERLVREGVAPGEARRRAYVAFGGVERYVEEARDGRRLGWVESVWRDLRHALRRLARSPGFALAVILSLALGVGANASVFALIRGVLLRPLPYAHPDRLVSIGRPNDGRTNWVSFPDDAEAWRRGARTLVAVAKFMDTRGAVRGVGTAEYAKGAAATGNLLDVLGVHPLLGRWFTSEEVRGAGRFVVLSRELWERQLAGDPRAIGRSIEIDGVRRTVVGVLPRGVGLPLDAEYWIPGPRLEMGEVVARARPGASLTAIRRELTRLSPTTYSRAKLHLPTAIVVAPLRERLYGSHGPALRLLLGAVLLLFLIACANISSLALARTVERRHELAIRVSLGASRRALVRDVFAENLLLALAGGGAGILVAVWSTRLFLHLSPVSIARLPGIGVGATSIGYAAGLALLAAGVVSIAPALALTRGSLNPALGGEAALGTGPQRMRKALMVAQLAVALLLLTGCGLLVRSMERLESTDLGFNPRGLVVLHLDLAIPQYRDTAARSLFVRELTGAVGALPGVRSMANGPPPLVAGRGDRGYSEGFDALFSRRDPSDPTARGGNVWVKYVDPDYLWTFRIRILAGRGIRPGDDAGAPPVALLNAAAAKLFFPGESAVGRTVPGIPPQIQGDGGPVTVVGVLSDVRQRDVTLAAEPEIWMPRAQHPGGFAPIDLTIRTTGDPRPIVRSIRRTIAQLDADLAPERLSTMSSIIAGDIAPQRFLFVLFSAFAALALAIAVVGLAGVVSYLTERRTAEIGVRMALGARRAEVVRMVVADAVRLVALGIAAGLPLSLAASQLLARFLYEVSPRDADAFLAAPAVLGVAALVAAYLPARDAAKVDPMVALRSE